MNTAKKTLAFLNRLAGPALVLALGLVPAGCLVGDDKFGEAQLERDKFRGELQRLHLSNDDLKREITETYASCDLIGTRLTVMAALNIHEQYTAKLGRTPNRPEDPVDPVRRPPQNIKRDDPPKVVRKDPPQKIEPVVEIKPPPPPPPSRPDLSGADFGGFGN